MTGAKSSVGIFNSASAFIAKGVTIISSTTLSSQIGIRLNPTGNNYIPSNISDSSITLSGTSNAYIGIQNSSTSPNLRNIRISIIGDGNFHTGIANSNNKRVNLFDSIINIESAGTFATGVSNGTINDSTSIYNSNITANDVAVLAQNGIGANETYIINSFITGPINNDPICISSFTHSGQALNSACD
jgi:hypothetical protein